MRRAITLIIVLTVLTFGCGAWLDHWQTGVARGYQQGAERIRALLEEGRLADATSEQAYMHALWQHDQPLLNALVTHQYTRDVDEALQMLATALSRGWEDWALRALDELDGALRDIEVGDAAKWENLL